MIFGPILQRKRTPGIQNSLFAACVLRQSDHIMWHAGTPILHWRGSGICVTLAPAGTTRFCHPMHFKAFSAAVFGIDAYLVEVEVDVGSSRPGDFNVVGLPDIA